MYLFTAFRFGFIYFRFLCYDPHRRITAEEALKHKYFSESPLPVDPSMFPTWPARSEQPRRAHGNTPKPPSGGKAYAKLLVSTHTHTHIFMHMQDENKLVTSILL